MQFHAHHPARSDAPRRNGSSDALRPGFTLAEILIVLVVMASLACIVAPLLANLRVTTPDGQQKSPQQIATESNLRVVRDAITAYLSDMGDLPALNSTSTPKLHYLYVNPGTSTFDPRTQRGWRGPYLLNRDLYHVNTTLGFTTTYGAEGQLAVLDAWQHPLVLQEDPVTHQWFLVSAGPDGNLNTTSDNVTLIVR